MSRRHEIGVGALMVVALAVLSYMALKVGALRGLGRSISVTAELDDASGLTEGALVKIAGVEVGVVDGLTVVRDYAVVTLSLQEEALVRADAHVMVRARSVLGEKFLEVLPQSESAPLVASGGQLTQARGITEIDQLVNTLGPILTAMDSEQLAQALDHLTAAINEDPERIDRMLASTELLLSNGAQASQEAGPLLDDASALVDETRAAVGELHAFTAEARPILHRLDATVASLADASVGLPETADEAGALLSETRVAVADARGLIEDGRRVTARVEGSYGQVEQVLANLTEIDKWELRRLLREEGVLVRLRESEVQAE